MCEIILEWLSKSLIIIVRSIEIANIGKQKLQKGDDRLVAPPSKYLSKCCFLEH